MLPAREESEHQDGDDGQAHSPGFGGTAMHHVPLPKPLSDQRFESYRNSDLIEIRGKRGAYLAI
jgi:hypothetical protein